MNKKGFTLIELLAVIVILAIIALIVVPIVLNIIDDTKKESELRSIEFYLEAVELSIAKYTLDDKSIKTGTYNILEKGSICLSYEEDNSTCKEKLKVEVKGEAPEKGTIHIKSNKVKEATLILNHKKIIKNNKGELIYDPFENISISGVSPLTLVNSEGKNLVDYKIYGNSEQKGTPSPTNPIEIESVGDYDEATGKYIIPIKVNGKTTNIYLTEPLRKIGDYADYVDFETQQVVRNVYEFIVDDVVANKFSSSGTSWTNVYGYLIDRSKLESTMKNQLFGNGYCSILKRGYAWGGNIAPQKAIVFGGNTQVIYLINFLYDFPNKSDFVEFAKNNPFTISYILEKPIEEEIELPPILLNKGKNIIEVDTTIQPSNMEITYMGKQKY